MKAGAAAVDVRVFELLRADPTLASLVPGGLYRDIAPEAVIDTTEPDAAGNVFGVLASEGRLFASFCDAQGLELITYDLQYAAPATHSAFAQQASERAAELLAGLVGESLGDGWTIMSSRLLQRLPRDIPDSPLRWSARLLRWELWAAR